MNIDLIGGSGFIGTALCRILIKKNISVNIIDKSKSFEFGKNSKIADVRDIKALRKTIRRKSTIINLAAEHKDNIRPKSLYDEVNIGGAINVCEVAKKRSINTIVFTSSVAVYGFAKIGASENAKINPFNDYGRTKWEAEQIYMAWQAADAKNRTLVIIRPTVVFGEKNRGNVYNLLKQIASGKFLMVGDGKNKKSLAYVENVAAFIEYSLAFKPGIHIYNYIDKPDFTMNSFVSYVNNILGRHEKIKFKIPYLAGYCIGIFFDFLSYSTGKTFPISSIRVKKFCSNSIYNSGVSSTRFSPPVLLKDALERTVKYEFMEVIKP